MTAFKDWNEAHFNGYHAREAADFIWTEAETQARAAQPSGKCDAESGDHTRGDDSPIKPWPKLLPIATHGWAGQMCPKLDQQCNGLVPLNAFSAFRANGVRCALCA